jgi:uncharacterized protein
MTGENRYWRTGLTLVLWAASSVASAADSPLADAAEQKNGKNVRELLEKGVDVNQAQVDGMTALHWAAYHDDLELAKDLIGAGANVDAENRYFVTPLSLACTNGNGALVEVLLETGAGHNGLRNSRETPLMTAARTGKLGPVKALLNYGAEIELKDRKGQTALMWAAAEGHAEVVAALLEAHADFRKPLPSGFTPLFFAVREGRTDVVKMLLRAGIDVNATMQPAKGQQANTGISPLSLAVENGHFELALALVDAGADPNDQRSGFTALHMVTWVRKPNRGDSEDGNPPPRGSGNVSSLDFVKALAARGANVNEPLKKGASGRGVLKRTGATPFLLASMTADVPLMKLLLDLGADPLLPNADHCTPLMAAAGIGTIAPGEEAGTESESLEAIELLLKLDCDVNAVDDNGETAMHGAAYNSFPKVVALLAEKGARIDLWNRKNKYGWTPLMIAEGHRVGNFKPSAETVAAIHRVMLAAGVKPPAKPTPRVDGPDYVPAKAEKAEKAKTPTKK